MWPLTARFIYVEATGSTSEIHEIHVSITLKMHYMVLGFGISLKENLSSDSDYLILWQLIKYFLTILQEILQLKYPTAVQFLSYSTWSKSSKSNVGLWQVNRQAHRINCLI